MTKRFYGVIYLIELSNKSFTYALPFFSDSNVSLISIPYSAYRIFFNGATPLSDACIPHKNLDLVSIGDLVIDFGCLGESESGMLLYERNPGGSVMNVAAQLSRLGGKAGAIACVGADEHGEYLRGLIAGLGIDARNISTCSTMGTRLLFVYFKEGGERYFTDYRGPRPDLEIDPDRIDYGQIAEAKVLLHSPLCNSYQRPIYETTRRALDVAKKNGVLTAFDVNFRFPYEDEKLRRLDIESMRNADILKMTAEEFAYYMEEDDIVRGADRLVEQGTRVVAVSMGRDGCYVRSRRAAAYRPAYAVNALDTTGAGDSFMGALIYQLTRPGIDMDALDGSELERIAEFANACASTSTTRRGSLLVMPDKAEVGAVMAATPLAPIRMVL